MVPSPQNPGEVEGVGVSVLVGVGVFAADLEAVLVFVLETVLV